MPQHAYIYRSDLGDCSNGGISSRTTMVTAYGPNELYNPPMGEKGFTFLGREAPPVRIMPGNVPGSVKAVPMDPNTGKVRLGSMAGGCYIASCDSRFWDMVAEADREFNNRFHGAVKLHDRYE